MKHWTMDGAVTLHACRWAKWPARKRAEVARAWERYRELQGLVEAKGVLVPVKLAAGCGGRRRTGCWGRFRTKAWANDLGARTALCGCGGWSWGLGRIWTAEGPVLEGEGVNKGSWKNKGR